VGHLTLTGWLQAVAYHVLENTGLVASPSMLDKFLLHKKLWFSYILERIPVAVTPEQYSDFIFWALTA